MHSKGEFIKNSTIFIFPLIFILKALYILSIPTKNNSCEVKYYILIDSNECVFLFYEKYILIKENFKLF